MSCACNPVGWAVQVPACCSATWGRPVNLLSARIRSSPGKGRESGAHTGKIRTTWQRVSDKSVGNLRRQAVHRGIFEGQERANSGWLYLRVIGYRAGMNIDIHVPATLSNLASGFDVLGMAVRMSNRFRFTQADRWLAGGQACRPQDHLALLTAQRAGEHFGQPCPALAVEWEERVPRSRGLGSSATARVAGLVAWAHAVGAAVDQDGFLDFLADEEGHPDNAAPALVGGLVMATKQDGRYRVKKLPSPNLSVAVVVPEVEVSTDHARGILPEQVPFGDAVYNSSKLAFLVAGLIQGDAESVGLGLKDRLHQPYRGPLIGPVEACFDAAIAAGAMGAFISGSGSTLAAFAPSNRAAAVAAALGKPFDAVGVANRTFVLEPEPEGALSALLG